MGIKFGEKLRQARLRHKLTQAQLGAGKYSTSYISLLETGSREPTSEIITELSARLELDREVMESWNTPVSADEAEFVLLEHRARQSYLAREYTDAEATSMEAATVALRLKNSSAWWNMMFLRAEALRDQGRFDDYRAAAEEVLTHPLTEESLALKVRAETLVANAYLGLGKLHIAVEHALKAVEQGRELPGDSLIYIGSLYALIASLAESGQLEQAWSTCQTLSEAVAQGAPSQTAGSAYWAIGNVAFKRQDIEAGLLNHRLAAERLRPASDIELWARFNKASASMRLAAGVVEEETLQCIERAELALSVIGGNPAESLELQLIRGRWLHLNGQPDQALEQLEPVIEGRELLSQHLQGELDLLTARSLVGTGRPQDALEHLASAQRAFASAGSPDRASLAIELATEIRSSKR
ncbi:helix-turn-helix transcriptional regulator [Zafaria sp. Z1313]|uniref:helix-turn-helix transcriptional regulator n=1 Tax=unclassified Zafaria TaxID=2828765 RepID=UPI002E788B4F|nr:helix-turn-helix transcriptional regulator [Zafaria sp. J156]MEE1621371.1 helix-turn-helix transcriptional regulator [Zafaria sp. J156]